MEKPHEVNQVDLLYSALIAMELLCCHPYILHLHSNNGPGTCFNACSPPHLLTRKHEAGAVASRGVKKKNKKTTNAQQTRSKLSIIPQTHSSSYRHLVYFSNSHWQQCCKDMNTIVSILLLGKKSNKVLLLVRKTLKSNIILHNQKLLPSIFIISPTLVTLHSN